MSTPQAAERYVAGRMSEDEEREFEVAMLENAELAVDVDTRQRIKVGLQQLERRGELDALLSAPRPPFVSRPLLAAAASILMVVLFGATFWYLRGAPGGSGTVALRASAIGNRGVSATYILASIRANAAEPVLEAAASAAPLRLRVVPESPGANTFVATLFQVTSAGEVSVSPQARVTRGQGAFVELFVDPFELSSGRYRLRLVSEPDGTAADYSFTLSIVR